MLNEVGTPVSVSDRFLPAIQHREAGRYADATAWLARYIDSSPQDAAALAHLAHILLLTRRVEEAQSILARAKTLDPNEPVVLRNCARLYISRKMFAQAREAVDAALKFDLDRENLLIDATLAHATGRTDAALQTLKDILFIHPNYADALVRRGLIYGDLKDWDAALNDLQNAISLKPHLLELWLRIALISEQAGFCDGALAAANRYCDLQPQDAQAQNYLGLLYERQSDFVRAAALYQRALTLNPTLWEAHLGLGNIALRQRRFDEALVHYNQTIEIQPNSAEAHNGVASLLRLENKPQEAVVCYRRALAIDPHLAAARVNLGHLLIDQLCIADALEQAEIAARTDVVPFPHYGLGHLFARCGLTDKARLHLKMSLEADPADSQGASLILARLGGPVPPRAPDALVQRLYSERSSKWGEGSYRGAALVADALLNVMIVQADILDIGCGSGLVGERVRSRARVLHGIDISKSMIDRAKEKQVYDELHVTDLMEFLATRRSTYDAITAAAVLVHFGELIGVLKAVSGALRPNGLFVFTVFADDEASNGFSVGTLELASGGCYMHTESYLFEAAANTGFTIARLDREIHEYSRGQPQFAFVVVARK